VICLSVSAIVIGGAIAGGSETTPNVVSNGGFEVGGDVANVPANWKTVRASKVKGFFLFEWDDDVFHTGGKSVSIIVRDNHPDVQVYYSWYQAPLSCTPGKSYEVSGWAKAKDVTESASIVVQCWDRGMKKILNLANTYPQYEVVGTTDWVRVSAVFEVPEDTWRVVILAGIPGHSNPGGRVWFDDIVIGQVSGD
jgi:hypothetical protein